MPHDAAPRLFAKLTGLDLEDDEAALLTTVFQKAAEADAPEVEGFAQRWHEKLSAQTNIFPSRSVRSFKGTDEELQAIVDWLGSLEAQE